MRIVATALALGLALAGGRASAQPPADDLAQARAAFEAHDFKTAYAHYSALTASPYGAEAAFVLSVIVKDGYGVVRADPEQALVLLRRAAEGGEPRAIGALGMAYLEGDGVPQSLEEAKRIWRRGAELNQTSSLYNLGYMARYADRRPAEAAAWFERAVVAGDTESLSELADLLDRGEGVPRDSARAVDLWRQAFAAGAKESPTKLAQAFFEGSGVARDPVKAQAWVLVAEKAGNGVSPEGRNAILANLTPEQRAEAVRLADRCLAAPSTDCP
ncbi:tetratricopeptide repeat protein [Caulobacter sp. 17J80-11]|uniref:tetratricopeptide repeat protein n=1 Tax=Caulobacter sp. 17J80-11 TaxID=2763502 RepID=UPI00165353D9|nr:tetratricopeptide repeat protein [Caulobacter sp. 17J80-11]MBC6981998.1 sel1 repeat family protein [Caulobacter sp. 17J80-11]